MHYHFRANVPQYTQLWIIQLSNLCTCGINKLRNFDQGWSSGRPGWSEIGVQVTGRLRKELLKTALKYRPNNAIGFWQLSETSLWQFDVILIKSFPVRKFEASKVCTGRKIVSFLSTVAGIENIFHANLLMFIRCCQFFTWDDSEQKRRQDALKNGREMEKKKALNIFDRVSPFVSWAVRKQANPCHVILCHICWFNRDTMDGIHE